MRSFLAAIAAVFIVLAGAYPGAWGVTYSRRECYRLFELVGIMKTGGPLGGQIAGFNYQRNPAWAHSVAIFASVSLVFGPILLGAGVAHRAITGRARETRCGVCGGVLRGLREARCPHCGCLL